MTDLRQASKSGKGCSTKQEVMKNLSDESFCFCLGSATWACIGWPVIVVDTPGANHCGALGLGDACLVLDAEGQADFMFIEFALSGKLVSDWPANRPLWGAAC